MVQTCAKCHSEGPAGDVRPTDIGNERLCKPCFSKHRKRKLVIYCSGSKQSFVEFPGSVPYTIVRWAKKSDYSNPILEPLRSEEDPPTPEIPRSQNQQEQRNNDCRLSIEEFELDEEMNESENENDREEDLSCDGTAKHISEIVLKMEKKNAKLLKAVDELRKEVEEKESLLENEKKKTAELSEELEEMKRERDELMQEAIEYSERMQRYRRA